MYSNRRILFFGAWFCVIFLAFLSLIPSSLEVRTGVPDELEHLIAYFVAAVLFGLSYPRKYLFVASALVIIAGVLEALQVLVPGRSAHLLDFWSGGAGAILGVMTVSLIIRRNIPR
jgi:VanZ family protein